MIPVVQLQHHILVLKLVIGTSYPYDTVVSSQYQILIIPLVSGTDKTPDLSYLFSLWYLLYKNNTPYSYSNFSKELLMPRCTNGPSYGGQNVKNFISSMVFRWYFLNSTNNWIWEVYYRDYLKNFIFFWYQKRSKKGNYGYCLVPPYKIQTMNDYSGF